MTARQNTQKARRKKTRTLGGVSVTSSISSDLVNYLQGEGMTLKRIGEMAGVGESFVCRVRRGDRRFSLEHMVRFEKELGECVPVLLLEAVWRERVSPAQRKLFDEAVRLLRESTAIRGELVK
jgi:hypothetical protein